MSSNVVNFHDGKQENYFITDSSSSWIFYPADNLLILI